MQEGDGEGPAIDPSLDKVAPEEARQEDARAHDDTQPDYSKFKNWEKLKADPELFRLFETLREYVRSLGSEVLVNPTQEYISFKTSRRTIAYVFPQTNRLKVFVNADLENTVLREEFYT